MKIIISTILLLANEISGNDHSICEPHKWRTPSALVEVGVCPSNKPDLDVGLCYDNCKPNYTGGATMCWENCDGTEVGAICVTTPLSIRTKKSYGRGAGTIPDGCGSGKANYGGLCYTPCKSGYYRDLLTCRQSGCPSGFDDNGWTCFKWDWFNSQTIWKDSYGIGVGTIPNQCPSGKSMSSGLCYKSCDSGYYGEGPVCWENCKAGETNDGATCRIPEVSHWRPSYDRGVGTSLVCPSSKPEQIGLDCYQYCDEGYTGFAGICTSNKFTKAIDGIARTAPIMPILISGCNIETLIKGVMMLDTLSGHDFAGDGFDICYVDDVVAGADDSWSSDKGVFAVEFRVGYDPPVEIDTEQFGLLAQISSVMGRDYTDYDNFRADIEKHADTQTLNDLDIFLRWLWEQVLNKSAIHVYVGLAFESHADGMNVYLYYGHCDESVMEVGLNQLVYRSVDDIGGLIQMHAPTVTLFGVGVGWVYGLDEDCSLQVVGMGIGKGPGNGPFDINIDHLADEDGLQCETRQVIALNAPRPVPQPTAKPIAAPLETPSKPIDDAPKPAVEKKEKWFDVRRFELLTDTKRTWSEAQAACQEKFGTDLASIHNMGDQGDAYEVCELSGGDCWIGLHRNSEDESGWKWSDGKTVDFGSDYSGGVYPWANNEPNNWLGRGEECALLKNAVSFEWNDERCDVPQYALCNADARWYEKVSTNTAIQNHHNADGLVIDGKLQQRGCGSGESSSFGLIIGNSFGKKWHKIRYTIEFVSGASSCWSLFGDTHYGQFEDGADFGLTTLKVIDNGLTVGQWNGEKKLCNNEKSNFMHKINGVGNKGYLTVEQDRDLSVERAGISSGFSCTEIGQHVRYKDISVAYWMEE